MGSGTLTGGVGDFDRWAGQVTLCASLNKIVVEEPIPVHVPPCASSSLCMCTLCMCILGDVEAALGELEATLGEHEVQGA